MDKLSISPSRLSCPFRFPKSGRFLLLPLQANNAFEAMAAAADTAPGNPAVLSDVIAHQLGPLPRLLDGFASGCATLPPLATASSTTNFGSSLPNSMGGGGGGGDIISNASPNSSLKRPKSECLEEDDRPPGKKFARGDSTGGVGGAGAATSGGGSDAAGNGNSGAGSGGLGIGAAGHMSSRSENGGGASPSPAAAAPPASNNLLAQPATADFRHGGGEEMVALLKAKVGRLFSLEAEYTHVRSNNANGSVLAACGVNGTAATAVGGVASDSSVKPEGSRPDGVGGGETGADSGGADDLRRVLYRLKAVRAGQFVAYIQFDVAGNEFRPCDVSVLSWGEAGEGSASATDANGGVEAEDGGSAGVGDSAATGQRGFMDALDGTTPWRTSQHTAFIRVSGHAYQVWYSYLF